LRNFLVLVAHVRVQPAMEALIRAPDNRVRGFLAAGHVCTVMGHRSYEEFVERYRVPVVVTGFEPLDILQGVYMLVKQLEEGRAEVENQYSRAVQRAGNLPAQDLIRQVFQVIPRKWRGIGSIPHSGLGLRPPYDAYDAEPRFHVSDKTVEEPTECISGQVLQGIQKPPDCPAYGTRCTPEHPLGATMVSGEGACAGYYRYRRISPN
jgi:hydrogenase expression/formation protein HypD